MVEEFRTQKETAYPFVAENKVRRSGPRKGNTPWIKL